MIIPSVLATLVILSVDSSGPRFPNCFTLHSACSPLKVGSSMFRYDSSPSAAILSLMVSLMAKTRSFAHPCKHGASWEEATLLTDFTVQHGCVLSKDATTIFLRTVKPNIWFPKRRAERLSSGGKQPM